MSGAELAALQTVRLKGRVGRAELDGAVDGFGDGLADGVVDGLVAAGLLADGPLVRLTEPGRGRLTELLAEERADVDPAAAEAVYQRFLAVNGEFKAVISRWQQERDTAGADGVAAVLAAVDRLHGEVVPVIDAAAALVPRLAGYAGRLDQALRRAKDGDPSWLTRPMVDSYHTVWFELHEELIGAAGRTRATEGD